MMREHAAQRDYNTTSSSKLPLLVDLPGNTLVKSRLISKERVQAKETSHKPSRVIALDKHLMLEKYNNVEFLEVDVIITNQILVPKAPPKQYNTIWKQ